MTTLTHQNTSKIKEVVATWSNVKQLLRTGDDGHLVPVVIPKGRRGFGWLFLALFALYLFGMGILGGGAPGGILVFISLSLFALASLWFWRSAIVEIEQGTTGILTSYGKIIRALPPGRHYLYLPWHTIAFIVDTSTEIPYTAPILACPTNENVPLKSIEFFLKFRIIDPIKFVRHIGASNFDVVLSSAVQDAIRRRSRLVQTERAYDLRGSDVNDMQTYLNRQMSRYGVRIIGANIPDVQLPDQYQRNLETRERVSKELSAYEKEWELKRKQRSDRLQLEIERAKKERDAKTIAVNAAINKAREDVAQMLQEKETSAQKIRLEIEAKGRAELASAENAAKALRRLGKSYKDNQAVLEYELALRRLEVAEKLVDNAPRPVLINSNNENGDMSPMSMLMLTQLLPSLVEKPAPTLTDTANDWGQQLTQAVQDATNRIRNT